MKRYLLGALASAFLIASCELPVSNAGNSQYKALTVPTHQKDWLSTRGNKIIDRNGNEVWLTGANWFGFNTGTNVFDGLWSANLDQAIENMANRGINLLRIPISTQLLLEWKSGAIPMPRSLNDWVNPGLKGLNSLQIFDYTVAKCKAVGMKIMMDLHSPGSDAMGHMDPVWYKGSFTTEKFLEAWTWFATKYKDEDTIIAYDLKNEPHGKPWQDADFAKWDNSNSVNNWKKAAEDTGRAILAINPYILIMVEGIEATPMPGFDYTSKNEKNYFGNWWGGNLRGVKDYPINLGANQAQLVYSPHDYGPAVYEQPWLKGAFTSDSVYRDCWKDNWAYIMENNIAPLLIGEWGGFMDGGANQRWMTYLRDYIVANKINHTFWCFNANSGDTGGLVKSSDWTTWEEDKYALIKPTLWAVQGKFVSLSQSVKLGANGTNLSEVFGNPLPNNPPIAKNDNFSAQSGIQTEFAILANDTDADGVLIPGGVKITKNPLHGSVSFNAISKMALYTSTVGYEGSDSFSYTVSDDDGAVSNEAIVSIAVIKQVVNKPPVANADSSSLNANQSVMVNVLANDTDSDGSIVITTVKIQSAPLHGSALVQSNGTVLYTPQASYAGLDSFTYTVKDNLGAESNIAKVDLEVKPVIIKPYTISFLITDDWGTGCNGKITVTNTGTAQIDNWTLEFDSSKKIDNFWTAQLVSKVGNHYTIKGFDWNKTIAPGQKLELGFGASPGGTSGSPTNFVLK